MFGSPRILFSCLPEFLPRKGRSYPALGCPVRSRGPESIPLPPPHGRRRKPKYTRPMDADFAKRCIAMQRQKVKILIAINQFHRGDYYALARPLLVPPATADLFVRRLIRIDAGCWCENNYKHHMNRNVFSRRVRSGTMHQSNVSVKRKASERTRTRTR